MFKSVPQKEKIKTAPYATKDTTGVVSLVSSTCNLSTKMLNEAGLMAPQITRVASKTVINGSVTLLAHSKIRALSHRPSQLRKEREEPKPSLALGDIAFDTETSETISG